MGLGQMASYHPWVVPTVGSHAHQSHHHINDSRPISLFRARPTSARCPHAVRERHPASMTNDEEAASPVSCIVKPLPAAIAPCTCGSSTDQHPRLGVFRPNCSSSYSASCPAPT